jgi:hypothetical protein
MPPEPASRRGTLVRPVLAFVRIFLLPIAVVLGLLVIAVALIEGPALDQFLYAVF